MKAPRISIITPSFMQAQHLQENLTSFQEQVVEEKEQLAVDGGSTDGSNKILEANQESLAWWVCEKDNGQSHAINKGLERATGDVFNWVNSDDMIVAGALQKVQQAFASDPQLIAFGGRVIHRSDQGDRVFEQVNDTADEAACFIHPTINQPATYYRMSAIREVGGVEEKLQYVMDLELWYQMLFKYGVARMRFEPVELAIFRFHDDSKTSTAHHRFLDETAGVLHGLCLRTDNKDLASTLQVGHQWPAGIRPINSASPENRSMVRKMVIHFLLKWNAGIHQQHQFQLMKAFRKNIKLQPGEVSDEQMPRLDQVDQQLKASSWTTFRLRRKLQTFRS